MKPSAQFSKPFRPASVKSQSNNNSNVMHVQTLQLNIEPKQQKADDLNGKFNTKKIQLSKTGSLKRDKSASPENQFDQFMQNKLQNNSGLKRVYEENQNENQSQRISSKPFQFQKAKHVQEDDIKSQHSTQSELTLLSQNGKKPYTQFYKNYKNFDVSIPSKKSINQTETSADTDLKKIEAADLTIANPSYASTQKSNEQTQLNMNDFDSVSVSSQVSQSSGSKAIKQNAIEQNFNQYVRMKKTKTFEKLQLGHTKNKKITHEQQTSVQNSQENQNINFQGWMVSTPQTQAPLPVRLQTRQYQSVIENYDQIIQNSTTKRTQYLKELQGYINMIKGGQQEKQEEQESKQLQKQNKYKPLSQTDRQILEKDIKKLARDLKQKDKDAFEKSASLTVSSLHSIAEEPLENLSNMTAQEIKNRSMFITEILKNRGQLQKRLQNQEEETDLEQPFRDMDKAMSQLDDRMQKEYRKCQEQNKSTISEELNLRINLLLQEDCCEDNPYDYFSEKQTKEKWDMIHNQLKTYNKDLIEFDALQLHNDVLPKDKYLRQEALERIITEKKMQVTKELQELADKQKSETLEDKYKIQDVLEKSKNLVQIEDIYEKYPHLKAEQKLRLQRIKDMEENELEMKNLIKTLNPTELLQDLNVLKQEYEQAIIINNNLSNQIHEDPNYKFAELIQEKKRQLIQLQIECNELDKKAEGIIRLEQILKIVNNDFSQTDFSLVQGEAQIIYPEEPQKSLQDYDNEITQKLKKEQPELFDFLDSSDL